MTHDYNLGLEALRQGRAQLVCCPACGQMEIWSVEAYHDHGMCRTYPFDVLTDECAGPVCGAEAIAPTEGEPE